MGNGIGIASFVISLIVCLLTFIVLPMMIWRAMAVTALTAREVIAVATLGIILLVLDFIGIIFGIVGTATNDTKAFGILGLIISAICLLFLIGAMAIVARIVWS